MAAMERCTTTHGIYRCKHPHGHGGDCEADDRSRRQIPIGPYHNRPDLTAAYVRGAIDFGTGGHLDTVGAILGVERGSGEPDCAYRPRLTRAL